MARKNAKGRVEIFIAIVGLIGTIIGATIYNWDKLFDGKNGSPSELIKIYDNRADNVMVHLKTKKQEAINSIRNGKGYAAGSPQKEAKFLERLDKIQDHFLSLHKKNIEALRRHQLILSKEIVDDIQALLWIHNRDVFWGSLADPSVRYAVNFPPVSSYAKIYPFYGSDAADDDSGGQPKMMGEAFDLDLDRIEKLSKELAN